jgi:hypothetical protein
MVHTAVGEAMCQDGGQHTAVVAGDGVPVHGKEGACPARQFVPQLADDVQTALNVGGVVEDGIPQQDHVPCSLAVVCSIHEAHGVPSRAHPLPAVP